MTASLDLGYPVLDVRTSDTKRAVAFYKGLGFENGGPLGPHAVLQGHSRLVFMDFLSRDHINLRGPHIPRLADALRARGMSPVEYSDPVGGAAGTHPEDAECGAFSLFDPDGAELFFNTNPGERAAYDAKGWDWGYPPGVPPVPIRVPLGRIAVFVGARDWTASRQFYDRLGCTTAVLADRCAVVTFGSGATQPMPIYTLLREAPESSTGIGFLCDDVELAAGALSKRGLALQRTRDGRAFQDPDGRWVELFQMPRNSLSGGE